MASTFVYPNNSELDQVDQVLMPALTLDDPIFRYFPIRSHDASLIMWEQRDNYRGLTQVRGLNGEPPRVQAVGGKRYIMEPGVYGEYAWVDEMEITTRRAAGTYNAPMDLTTLIRERQDQLRHRQIMRVRQVLWELVVYGRFTVLDPKGAIAHQDSFTQRLFDATVAWGTIATATPLADFRSVALLGRGYGTSFGAGSVAFMNQQTANYLLANTNASDLYGRRSSGLSTLNTMSLVNQLLTGDGMPMIEVYDEGYLNDSNVFTLFIPDNKVVVFGRRPNGVPIGEFAITRNASATPIGAAQTYTIVTESETPPKTIRVDYGFNGGPKLEWPSSIVVMDVA